MLYGDTHTHAHAFADYAHTVTHPFADDADTHAFDNTHAFSHTNTITNCDTYPRWQLDDATIRL